MKLMAGLADARKAANDLLDHETADAWAQYVYATRTAASYEKVEPWAWSRLQQRLRQIAARRERLQ